MKAAKCVAIKQWLTKQEVVRDKGGEKSQGLRSLMVQISLPTPSLIGLFDLNSRIFSFEQCILGRFSSLLWGMQVYSVIALRNMNENLGW